MITLRGSLRLYCCDEVRDCSMVRHYVITLRGSLIIICSDDTRYCSMVRYYVITLRGSLRLYVVTRLEIVVW